MSMGDDLEFTSDALGFTPMTVDDGPDHVMRTCAACGGYFPTKPGSAFDRAALCHAHLLVRHAR